MTQTFTAKEVGEMLNIPPTFVTKRANELYETEICDFRSTPLGVFRFTNHDVTVLYQYINILTIFGSKRYAREELKKWLEEYNAIGKPDKHPEWIQKIQKRDG